MRTIELDIKITLLHKQLIGVRLTSQSIICELVYYYLSFGAFQFVRFGSIVKYTVC